MIIRLLVVISLLLVRVGKASETAPVDFSRALVIVYTAKGCPPCEQFKREAESQIRKSYPDVWWAFSNNWKPPTQVNQYGKSMIPYRGESLNIKEAPTFIVNSWDGDSYEESSRLTGWKSGDREVLETLIKRAVR